MQAAKRQVLQTYSQESLWSEILAIARHPTYATGDKFFSLFVEYDLYRKIFFIDKFTFFLKNFIWSMLGTCMVQHELVGASY